jgi:hypothetical protein
MTIRINPRWRIAHYIRPKYFKNQEKFVRRAARPTPFKEIYFENVVLGLRESESRFALIEAVLVVEMSYTHLKIFGLFFLPITRLCIALLCHTTVSLVLRRHLLLFSQNECAACVNNFGSACPLFGWPRLPLEMERCPKINETRINNLVMYIH